MSAETQAPAANPALRLVACFGDKARVAEHFKVSREAVRLWLKNGIPPDRALEAEDATRGSAFEISAIDVLEYARQQKMAVADLGAEQLKRAVA